MNFNLCCCPFEIVNHIDDDVQGCTKRSVLVPRLCPNHCLACLKGKPADALPLCQSRNCILAQITEPRASLLVHP